LAGDPAENLALQNEDAVTIYRESQFFPEKTVSIWGAVHNPGTYSRNEKMSLAELVVLAGGLREDASLVRWQVSRMETTEVSIFSRTFSVDVGEKYWEDELALDFLLEDMDVVSIPTKPGYSYPRVVKVEGFVMYPGAFSVRFKGERLADIVDRAGGLKPGAYLEGARFYRTMDGGGLIPVNFKTALADRKSLDNIELFDGDSIYVPEREDVVYVRGEVFTPGGVLYERGAGLSHYLKQAGGTRDEADEGRVFVTLPNGQKWESGGWFLPDPDILPGSVVYVPRKIEREDKTLPVLRDLATILASLAAITVAMVQVWR
jgi:protein involved in polysaccharide export with SLBB domain